MMPITRRFLTLLVCAGFLAGALPAYAEQLLTIGLAPGPQALVRDEAEAQTFVARLAEQLSMPTRLRLFADEAQLREWLQRFREVDCAWLSDDYLRRIPAGEVLHLMPARRGDGAGSSGAVVARQGLDAVTLQQLRTALLAAGLAAQGDRPGPAAPPAAPPVVAAPPLAPPAPAPGEPVMTSAVVEPVPAAPVTPVAPVAPPAPPRTEDAPAALAADELEYHWGTRVFRATGAVELQRGDSTLAADEVLWQDATRDALASGHVRLSEPGGELAGSGAHTNLGSGRGLVRDGSVFVRERNFHLRGTELERLGESNYRISDGAFTSCDGDPPDWAFTADEVDVDLGSYATARNVWFEVRDLPLLYLPYLVFPVKSERESGFLLPRAGYSSRKGTMLSLAWYEVIDRHLDATLYLDYLSRIGVGKGLEYRYDLGGPGQGRAYAYHVSGRSDTPDSYALDWQHEGTLPGEVRLAADIEYVNKREYFEDFGESAEEYNRDQTISTLIAQRHWGKLNLTGYARYIKDLENDNDDTLQRLPEAGMDVPFYRLEANPLFTRTELRATNFWREDDSVAEDGQRLYLRQGLGLVLKPGSWLEFTPEVAVYGRYYHVDSGDESDLIPEYSATLSTRLLRVYPFDRWGIDAIQHSIEPQVSYTYVPNENQDDLPLFDLKDRIGPLNLAGYALINRLTARTVGSDGSRSYRELLNLRLSQSYDVREARDDARDDPEPFSNLRAELLLRPTVSSALDVDALIRLNGQAAFARLTAGAAYGDGRGNVARLDYAYRSADSGFAPTDYLSFSMETPLLAPVYTRVEERYDFNGGGSLETVVGLEYRASCWSLFLTYRDRTDEEEVLVGFSLAGLGRVGGFGSSLRSSAK